MFLRAKKSESGEWGYVESFNVYRYGTTGSTTVVLGVTPEGNFASPYVYRGGDFVPLKQIEREMGIEKYIRAKKPFYSKLRDGFIVKITANTNFYTGECLVEKNNYVVYSAVDLNMKDSVNADVVLKRVHEVPEQVINVLDNLSVQLASYKGVREQFLKSRL